MYLAYPGLVVVSILMESCVPQIILILDSYVTSSTSEDVTKVTTSRKRVRVSKSPSKLEDATNHTLTSQRGMENTVCQPYSSCIGSKICSLRLVQTQVRCASEVVLWSATGQVNLFQFCFSFRPLFFD